LTSPKCSNRYCTILGVDVSHSGARHMRGPTLSYNPVLAHVVGVTITAVNLAANLAGRESGRVYVDIG